MTQHILIIGKVWPEPDSSAAGARMLQLIQAFLSQGWKISFASTASENENVFDLKSLGINKYTIELNNQSFNSFIKNLEPSFVMFDRFSTEEQFGWRVAEHCPNAIRVLDTEDLHCLRAAREQALIEKKVFAPSYLLNQVAWRELASIYRCDLSLIISEFEMELLHQFFKVDPDLLHLVPFLLDQITEEEKTNWKRFSERKNFVTLGNFLHAPNFDSIAYLKTEIWPLIRKKLPDAKIYNYGAYPSQKVYELSNEKEGFFIKGRAANVKEILSEARLCLAPLRFGAGLKGKLTDAMLCGTPSVTTHIGAESMHGKLPWSGTIADLPNEFADASCQLYTNEIQWGQAQENGYEIINKIYSKEKSTGDLLNALLTVQKNLKEHRSKNFTGTMLMHHTAMGVKYMSLWIEQKNKEKDPA